jgi:hypothetical protein
LADQIATLDTRQNRAGENVGTQVTATISSDIEMTIAAVARLRTEDQDFLDVFLFFTRIVNVIDPETGKRQIAIDPETKEPMKYGRKYVVKPLVKTKEVAKYFGICEETVRRRFKAIKEAIIADVELQKMLGSYSIPEEKLPVKLRKSPKKSPTKSRDWTPDEDRLIQTLSVSEAEVQTGRTKQAIHARRARLRKAGDKQIRIDGGAQKVPAPHVRQVARRRRNAIQ